MSLLLSIKHFSGIGNIIMSKPIRINVELHQRLKAEALRKGQTLSNFTSGLLKKGLNSKRKSISNGVNNPKKSGYGWVTGFNGERIEIRPLLTRDIKGYYISVDNTLRFNNLRYSTHYTYNSTNQEWEQGFHATDSHYLSGIDY
jgi:hypothetical protein